MQPTTFSKRLFRVVNELNRNAVKEAIGDSTDNNRTLTVGQVARYLTSRRNKGLRRLGNHLLNTKGLVNNRALINRYHAGSNRSDAVDINEFINSVDHLITNSSVLPYSYGSLVDSLKRA